MTSGADPRPALPRSLRRSLGTAGALSATVVVSLGVLFHGQRSGSEVDTLASAGLRVPVSSAAGRLADAVQTLSDPLPAAGLLVLLVAVCLLRGQRRAALVAVLGPVATDVVVAVTKHAVGRTIHGSLSYPSTHSAHLTAVAMVVSLVLVPTAGLRPATAAAVVLGAGAASAAVMGWALVAGDVHYATDAFAGCCVAVAVVPAVAVLVDAAADRRSARLATGDADSPAGATPRPPLVPPGASPS